MSPQYDYIIGVHKLIPPIGLYNYVAKVVSLSKMAEDTTTMEILEPKVGESVGVTQAEAIAELEREVKRWIASHN
jgi:hypothetical protein